MNLGDASSILQYMYCINVVHVKCILNSAVVDYLW